ncbi:MAG TPA: tRNA preQ1(34) S-adenosylmethionine ribosyltransferase-isomerase QueA [Candidatus Wallbacteria bacterium]|nr:MAG: S-adenosylmethionine:tRNA ribosyltransferase-isomerase [bacterium ADurb.Bin243]HOD40861.1 tRNA preQ1(34) S-adenosylmethionine ribosyltransferase-isomerase QueA [Candidatus Wallbacteria bacterium]HPG58066.1 tRNA preQ1(34) S-adenosylmethionine ribosyltransferase-isomerase QueA [Candidatus Wallbacteria bacterium]
MTNENTNHKFDITSYDFALDDSKIAVRPYLKRDEARLLVFDRSSGEMASKKFGDIVDYFNNGDMLILNETRVFKARLYGTKHESGARIELLLLRRSGDNVFSALVKPSRRIKPGVRVHIDGGLLDAVAIGRGETDGAWLFEFEKKEFAHLDLFDIVDMCGHVPLPPYIIKNKPAPVEEGGVFKDDQIDCEGYQTVYARESGSVAAPTAGFHFTPDLLSRLCEKGVAIEKITLHVGLGTFKLVEKNDIRDHVMHKELIKIEKDSYSRITGFIKNKNGKKLFCCGTTSVRTIESIDRVVYDPAANSYCAETDLFIYDGYKFKNADAMITNFHLPKSTLLMMVSAFMGNDKMKSAYDFAINNDFMFYSYGDAMLVI